MERKKLLDALKQLKVQTGSLVCMGCGHEHNCGIHGCAIIREAMDYIVDLETTYRTEMCEDSYDCMELGKVRKALQVAEARAEKAEKERDAAVERIRQDRWCEDCKYQPVFSLCENDGMCDMCGTPCYCGRCIDGNLWKWRGEKEE